MTANQKIAKYRKEPTKTHRKNKPTNARETADDQVVVGLSMAFDWLSRVERVSRPSYTRQVAPKIRFVWDK